MNTNTMKIECATLPINDRVRFLEREHEYWCGMDKLVGVTAILNAVLFPNKYAGINEAVLRRAAERGTAIHDIVQTFEVGGIQDLTGATNSAWHNEQCAALDAWKAAKDGQYTQWLGAEYLVSDCERVASKIDLIGWDNERNGWVLADIKTTAILDREYLAWQLSIYDYLFYGQTGEHAVRLLGIWLRDGKCEIVELERKSDDKIREVIDAYFAHETLEPVKAQVPVKMQHLGQILGSLMEQQSAIEAEIKNARTALMQAMKDAGVLTFETDDCKVTYIAPTERKGFDTARFKREHAEMYPDYEKTAQVAETIKITIKTK